MTFKNQAGIGVFQNYGPRTTGNVVGIEDQDGSIYRLSVVLTGNSLNDGFLPPVVLPKGALLKRADLRVDEAFALGGTSPTVQIGAVGSVATNGIVLTQAELQAVGTKVPASAGAGTWATNSSTGTTAAAKVGVALGGTSPTVTAGVGKATLVLEFFNKAKA
jgi:hypothetical protein